ncbi:signal recognition particle, SRP9/SRP14 subunit [Aspergillus japonicus CBS 114.51]|uniref:Signal recognition particle subunit SRP14 n=2 Tax=Aspergillus TaxID=5052 RepID=A0A2V5HBW6_ASPV1|nr:signal recognition particle, SRP9/SRP14 subunit [Aspergillus japonicus CBS 114.51]PYI19862.1 signal recognition particle, SRP9/SRP14 subunit [Aspergillus violaceofuscus CBS 115571]RAH78505.1 signal recognition particle, SRP9/SRP14 subunit [Aspergillus japonicus CBS 114.51]
MPAHLNHEEFFTSLTTLLTTTSQKARGSVYLTQKPWINADSPEQQQPSILIRATDGNTSAPNPKKAKTDKKTAAAAAKKVKLSTVVSPEELEAFYVRYAEVCKAGMTGLKKRDRSKKKTAKGKAGGKVQKA